MSVFTTRIFTRKLFGDCKAVGLVCPYLSRTYVQSALVTENIHQIQQPIGAITYKNPDYFGVKDLYTVSDLFKARVHYGHVESNLHVSMKQFIFGSRLGHLIIDLDQTAELLYQALNFTAYIAYNGGIILFIGRNPQFTYKIERTAMECNEYSHTREWRQGLFLMSQAVYKTEVRLPDLIVFLNTQDGIYLEHPAIVEAAKLCIPTVGIVDTNCDRRLITYPIPGNDDSESSVQLYLHLFKEVILRAKRVRKEHDKKHNE